MADVVFKCYTKHNASIIKSTQFNAINNAILRNGNLRQAI